MTAADIEARIEEEMRSTSSECHNAAWAEGLWAGIDPWIIADTAVSTALAELGKYDDEKALLCLLDQMRERVLAGDFSGKRIRH